MNPQITQISQITKTGISQHDADGRTRQLRSQIKEQSAKTKIKVLLVGPCFSA